VLRVSCRTHMRTWFQRWLSAAAAAAAAASAPPAESRLSPDPEWLVKDATVALEAERPSEDVVARPPCCCCCCVAAGAIDTGGGHLAAGDGGHAP
jgi:streptolysin S family bacteriocin protoxin